MFFSLRRDSDEVPVAASGRPWASPSSDKSNGQAQRLNFYLNLLQLLFFLLQYVDNVFHDLRANVRIRFSPSGSTLKHTS